MKAVVFDFDGLLVDSLQLNFDVKRDLFRPYGIEMPKQEFIDVWVSSEPEKHGNTYYVKLKGLSVDPAELRRKQAPVFDKYYLERANLMPGALKLLRLLRKKSLPVAVVSSNYRRSIEIALKKFRLEKEFEFIISCDECKKGKPDPAPYLMAVERFGCGPGEVLALEDSEMGVRSAKAAGCRCIAVPNSFTEALDFSKADLVVKSLSEINSKLLAGL